MSVAVDPLASVRAWVLEADLGGHEYQVRPALTGEWLPILLGNQIDIADIVPGLFADPAEEERLEADLMEGRVREAEVREAALEVISAAAGREWWWVMNLLATASSVWMDLYGSLVGRGVNVPTLPFGAFLDALYAEMVNRLDKEHRKALDQQLNVPPVEEAIDEDREAAAFLALMNGG